MDRNIIRFSHCEKYIYCFSFYNNACDEFTHSAGGSTSTLCPVCNGRLKLSLEEAPVSVPNPLVNGHAAPYAFTIGSMHGPSFISEWDNSELHVGITNSEGVVYSFTMKGVQRDRTGWERCIAEQLIQPGDDRTMEQWDTQLEQFASSDIWAPERFYEEGEFGSCCYAFVLGFVKQIWAAQGKAYPSRDEFTATRVLPRMKTASKYVKVYREIVQNGFYITDKLRNGMG